MEDHGMLMGSCPADHGGDNGNAGTGYRLDAPDGYHLTEKNGRKGAVSMDDTGRAKKYTPLITREEASAEETHKLLNHVFKGKASLLVNQLVDSGDLSAEDLQEILKVLLK